MCLCVCVCVCVCKGEWVCLRVYPHVYVCVVYVLKHTCQDIEWDTYPQKDTQLESLTLSLPISLSFSLSFLLSFTQIPTKRLANAGTRIDKHWNNVDWNEDLARTRENEIHLEIHFNPRKSVIRSKLAIGLTVKNVFSCMTGIRMVDFSALTTILSSPLTTGSSRFLPCLIIVKNRYQ